MSDTGFGLFILFVIIIAAIFGYNVGHGDMFDSKFIVSGLEMICVKDGDHCICVKNDYDAETETIIQCPPFNK